MTTLRKKNVAKELDQWYTKKNTVQQCISAMNEFGLLSEEYTYIEPSCGEGVFVDAIKYDVMAFDLDPKYDNCTQANWLETNIDTTLNKTIIFGNPPYGKKAKLAVDFINHSSTMANTICFIVPITLSSSYSAQRNVNKNMKLIHEETLPEKSFVFNGKEMNIPSVFQIWKKEYTDYRLNKPDTEHPDFETRIYNKMPTAKKWLNWDWDIAIKRNTAKGEYILKGEEAKDDYHWILIKCKDPTTIETMLLIDFSKLNDNKMVAGIGKADIVSAYKGINNDN